MELAGSLFRACSRQPLDARRSELARAQTGGHRPRGRWSELVRGRGQSSHAAAGRSSLTWTVDAGVEVALAREDAGAELALAHTDAGAELPWVDVGAELARADAGVELAVTGPRTPVTTPRSTAPQHRALATTPHRACRCLAGPHARCCPAQPPSMLGRPPNKLARPPSKLAKHALPDLARHRCPARPHRA